MKKRKGFTLIELVMVILLLGILAVVAIPKYFDLQNDAKDAAEKGVLGAVRAGVYTYFAKNRAYPATLDGASTGVCSSTTTPCFDNVLAQGGISDSSWQKTSATVYRGPANATAYTYNVTTGEFK